MNTQTPREIVKELDRYIVGQKEAKHAVAIALRNRWRRDRLDEDMKKEIIPKNILMIGSTGVGKTEIARRLAKLVEAPFIKVEATKFTEVGYVGRDVDSIVRDLAETAVHMVKEKSMKKVQEKAKELAEERILDIFVPEPKESKNPLAFFSATSEEKEENSEIKYKKGRQWCQNRLAKGELEEELVEIDVEENTIPMIGMFSSSNLENLSDSIQDVIGNIIPKKKKKRRVSVKEARKIFIQEEANKLVDMDSVIQKALQLAEQNGIVFLDEIDKIAVKNSQTGVDVSREGVQRDILPIVEGSTVMTKYGALKTDHVLFIAAGAFHQTKPSDLIPELQGRFPIRVNLESLSKEDFKRILTEPKNALTKQYEALLKTENVNIEFKESAIERLAELALLVNEQTENIGARRLHTILEKLLEEISFIAPDLEEKEKQITIDAKYVDKHLKDIAKSRDLSQFIL